MVDTARAGELPWCIGRWVAIRLSDGGSDGALYDSKAAAVRYQPHERQCVYFRINPGGLTPRSAESTLRFNQGLYDMGARLADPDMVVHQPLAPEQQRAVLAKMKRMLRRR